MIQRALTGAEAQAKLFLAKSPLHDLMPLVSSFLFAYPIRSEDEPLVFPAYVTPRPEIVVARKAVADLPVHKLRTILLHEALHPAFNVWMRYTLLTGKSFQDPDWDIFAQAHDIVINLLINEEIKRLDRLQLNGQKPGQDPLLQWPTPADGLDYGQPELDYAFWGMTLEEVFALLKKRREQGRSLPKTSNDCIHDGSSPEQIRAGYEKAMASLIHAAREAATLEAHQEDSGLVQLLLDYAKPKESFLSSLLHEIHGSLPQHERRTYAHPDQRYEPEDTGGVLRPGMVTTGQAVCIAIDVSDSTHADQAAVRFVEEVDAALDVWNGPLLLVLWDNNVRLKMMVDDRWAMRQTVQEVRSGGNTSLECLRDGLADLLVDDYGRDVPEIGLLIIRTDGEVPHWPEIEEWPCEEVLVVYTKQAPPCHIRSLLMGAA